ncbi:MAG: transporter substrate-binding domain-containing protein [Halopseudomonas aestusnigri]
MAWVRISLLSVVFLSQSFILSPSQAAETLVIASVEQEVNSFPGPDGRPTGRVIDLVRHGMERLGIEVEFKLLPWSRAINGTYEGRYDALLKPFWNPERHKHMDFSREVLLHETIVLYKRKSSPITFNGDWHSISQHKFGVIQGYSYGRIFDKLRKLWDLQTDEATNVEHNLKKLVAGRFDLLVGFQSYTEGNIKKFGLQDQVEQLPYIIDSVEAHIAFTKKKDLKDIREKFDQQIRWMRANNVYKELSKKYNVSFNPAR